MSHPPKSPQGRVPDRSDSPDKLRGRIPDLDKKGPPGRAPMGKPSRTGPIEKKPESTLADRAPSKRAAARKRKLEHLAKKALKGIRAATAMRDTPVKPKHFKNADLTKRERSLVKQAARDQLCLDSFARFVRVAWQIVEPGLPLNENWHIDAVAHELQVVYPGIRAEEPPFGWCHESGDPMSPERAAMGVAKMPAGGVVEVQENWRAWIPERVRPAPLWRGSRLVINIPPGHMKSLLVSVFWPAWIWLKDPGHRLLSIAGSETLATRDAMKTRSILDTAWYARLRDRAAANKKRTWDEVSTTLPTYLDFQNAPPGTYPAGMEHSTITRSVQQGLMGSYSLAGNKSWGINVKKDAKASFGTTVGGYRESKAINSRIIGERGYGWILDDPVDVKDILEHGQIDHERISQRCGEVVEVIGKTLMSRLNDKRPGRHYCVVIMQRLHIDDPAGALSKKGWRTVALRSRYIPDVDLSADDVPNYPKDPRHLAYQAADVELQKVIANNATALESGADLQPTIEAQALRDSHVGEPLFKTMYPDSVLDTIEKDELGAEQFNAQHQQNPLPGKGGTLNEGLERARRYDGDPYFMAAGTAGVVTPGGPMGELEQMMVVDATFGAKGATASNVSIEVWGRPYAAHSRAHMVLLDCVARRMNYTETEEAIKRMKKRWPHVRKILIEEKANGAALINRLSNMVPGVDPFDPKGSKTVRAAVFASCMMAGVVWLPMGDPRATDVVANPHTPWIDDFIMECARFPGGRRDDRVDGASMACIYWTENAPAVDPVDREKKRFNALRLLAKDRARGFGILG